MSQPAADSAPEAAARLRAALLKRLADLVCLPAERTDPHQKAVAVDLLIEALREAAEGERVRVAQRLSAISSPPAALVRVLLRDAVAVARPLLESRAHLGDAELVDCARRASDEHRALIAARPGVSEVVSDAILEAGDIAAGEVLLINRDARLGQGALAILTAAASARPELVAPLLARGELTPGQAFDLFWSADPAARAQVLRRFAAPRAQLREAVDDLYPVAKAGGWADRLTRRTLEFVGRRQRDRAHSGLFPTLEAAIQAARFGVTPSMTDEIARLAGVKPQTGRRIFDDPGGEALVVLVKAAGLPRDALVTLWSALQRPGSKQDLVELFDGLAIDRAQTVLRYWDVFPPPLDL
ncbi:DUF2336 domain-containing protein [Caulobacter sp. NIBR2454]|uniref:DUF2336 domain-containing protein n=1 Tax=Caulobacter sp. NIBR2454 TaxID=3015996 RepID=UPI0022B74D0C|nr:DUF2336 domain-containing protein [Caulobacter sp. NIBR2454]